MTSPTKHRPDTPVKPIKAIVTNLVNGDAMNLLVLIVVIRIAGAMYRSLRSRLAFDFSAKLDLSRNSDTLKPPGGPPQDTSNEENPPPDAQEP